MVDIPKLNPLSAKVPVEIRRPLNTIIRYFALLQKETGQSDLANLVTQNELDTAIAAAISSGFIISSEDGLTFQNSYGNDIWRMKVSGGDILIQVYKSSVWTTLWNWNYADESLQMTYSTASRLLGTDASKNIAAVLISSFLAGSASLSVTPDGAGGATLAVLPAGVDHNSTANLTTGDPHTQYLNASRGSLLIDSIVCYNGEVVTYDGKVVTYEYA